MTTIDFRAEVELHDALRVGRVIEVHGRSVRVLVDTAKNSAFTAYRGTMLRGVAVGTFLRILKGPVEIVGRVEGEFMSELKTPTEDQEVARTLLVSIIGKFALNRSFVGGVSELPLTSNVAYLLEPSQLARLYAFTEEGEDSMRLGTLADDPEQNLGISLDALLASHVGIFGNTGSGKSNTLALLLAVVAHRYGSSQQFRERARFVLLDFNGEYVARAEDGRTPLTPDPQVKRDIDLGNPDAAHSRIRLPLPAMFDAELWAILLDATQKTQLPLLRRAFRNRQFDEALLTSQGLSDLVTRTLLDMTRDFNESVERNSPVALLESLAEVFGYETPGIQEAVDTLRGSLFLNMTTRSFYADVPILGRIFGDNAAFAVWIEGLVSDVIFKVESLSSVKQVMLRIVLQFHIEIARGYANREFLAPLLKRLETRADDLDAVLDFAQETPGPPLTVVSLDRLNTEMQRIVSVLVTKYSLDEQIERRRTDPRSYLCVVIDEAHHVLSREASNESEQWRDYRLAVFESLVKEGRKYGAFLMAASQRPYDISPTVLSQLHNYFLHRLVNVRDIEAIERLVPFLDRVSFEQIPLLPAGQCVVTGLIVERPVVAAIRRLGKRLRPVSETIRPTRHW